jgi:hypothetical protein
MKHEDHNGRQIEIGDRVKVILANNMHSHWGIMTVTQLRGNWSVICKLTGKYQIPAYMASHLEVVSD